MKRISVRFTALVGALVATVAITTAVPATAAQTAAPTQGVGSLLAGLLDALRGPTAAPAPPPPPAPAPAAPSAAPTQVGPAPAPAPVAQPSGPTSPMAVEQRLSELHYFTGAVGGQIDDVTASAIMAFQKVHGLERTGQLSDPVAAGIMAESGSPTPLVFSNDANKVEIDLTRQVLFLYEGGSLSKILPVSSGTAQTPTPTGSYKIYHRAYGWETSPLGRLYNSQYFIGGYAVHGSLSVPNYPASHGCVRISMAAAEWFPDHVGIGTPVYVLG
jgi:lipoprotein-anchoring transpeptidase ErfK/SrfK